MRRSRHSGWSMTSLRRDLGRHLVPADGEADHAAGAHAEVHGLLAGVVEHAALHRVALFLDDLEHARGDGGPLRRQTDGRVQDHRQVVLPGQPQVLAEQPLLELRAAVEADLAHGHDALVGQELGHALEAPLGVGAVHAEERHRDGGEGLVAEGLRRGRLHREEPLPQKQHRVGVVRADEHVRARDDRSLHAHHHELLQLHVLDHVGVQVGVDESHAGSFRVHAGGAASQTGSFSASGRCRSVAQRAVAATATSRPSTHAPVQLQRS